jgi:hypothetical protein
MLKISYILNIFFIIIFVVCFYYSRDRVVYYANKYLLPNNIEKNIAVFNSKPYQTDINHINKYKYERTLKIAILGNSLSFHGIDALWDHKSGMAASNIEKDYVHILLNKISETKQYSIAFLVINIADFERGFNNFNYKRLENIKEFDPDILIFQIGENVTFEDIKEKGEQFKQKYIDLIKYCNVEKTIVCLPFWPQKEKLNQITEVAITTESYLVDLSHLGSGIEPLNLAKSENKYKNSGVAAHPGDFGMNSIANMLYITLNKITK